MLKLTLCISLLVSGSVADVAQIIKACTQTDFDCIVNSAKNTLTHMIPGVESLGLPALDPLFVGDITLNDGDLKLNIKDMVVHRLGQCTFNKIERDPIKSTVLLDAVCPLSCVGHYKVTGSLLSIPIEGEGPFEAKVDKLHIDTNIKLIQTNRDGKDYYKISDSDYNYEPLSKFSFRLDNLFNGDKAKADPINNLLDNSGNEIVLHPNIGMPIFREMYNELITIIDKLFQAVPINQLEIV